MGRIKYYSKFSSPDKDTLIRETLQPLMETCTHEVMRTTGSTMWRCQHCYVNGFGDDSYHQCVAPDEQYSSIDTWALMLLRYMPHIIIDINNTDAQAQGTFNICLGREVDPYQYGTHLAAGDVLSEVLCEAFLKWRGVIDERGKIVEKVEAGQ